MPQEKNNLSREACEKNFLARIQFPAPLLQYLIYAYIFLCKSVEVVVIQGNAVCYNTFISIFRQKCHLRFGTHTWDGHDGDLSVR